MADPAHHERALQLDYHRETDPEHLEWQVRGPYFAATEARLLDGVRLDAGERLLEIGCGEGANLAHLADRAGERFGVDFSFKKSEAARTSGASVACADATALPFAGARFDVVLIRDLLHHVPARIAVLEEAHRVLRPGGRLHLIEPNARAPLVVLQALTVRAERGLLRSTERRLRDELEAAGFWQITFTTAQPMPIARVLLHPHFGRPSLGASPLVRGALDAFDAAAGLVWPKSAWLYLCFTATRP
jgi:SAM-dependent methyltransferase